MILDLGLPFSEHTEAVAQSGMNLSDDSCPIGDKPSSCLVEDELSVQ